MPFHACLSLVLPCVCRALPAAVASRILPTGGDAANTFLGLDNISCSFYLSETSFSRDQNTEYSLGSKWRLHGRKFTNFIARLRVYNSEFLERKEKNKNKGKGKEEEEEENEEEQIKNSVGETRSKKKGGEIQGHAGRFPWCQYSHHG